MGGSVNVRFLCTSAHIPVFVGRAMKHSKWQGRIFVDALAQHEMVLLVLCARGKGQYAKYMGTRKQDASIGEQQKHYIFGPNGASNTCVMVQRTRRGSRQGCRWPGAWGAGAHDLVLIVVIVLFAIAPGVNATLAVLFSNGIACAGAVGCACIATGTLCVRHGVC